MYDIVFHSSARVCQAAICYFYPRFISDLTFFSQGDIIHIGNNSVEVNMEEVDLQTQAQPSTLGTGGGTDHDDSSIRARPLYRWEGILSDDLSSHERHHRDFLSKLAVWFGISPRWRAGVPTRGLALDVKAENGRYILLRGDESTEPSVSGSVQKGIGDGGRKG